MKIIAHMQEVHCIKMSLKKNGYSIYSTVTDFAKFLGWSTSWPK